MRADPKSAIKRLNLTVFFELLGFAHVKAACRMLVKLTPGRKPDTASFQLFGVFEYLSSFIELQKYVGKNQTLGYI